MAIHRDSGMCDWDNIPLLAYKEDGTHFFGIIRKTLFEGSDLLPGSLRYFEIAPGGHSTLEQHEHLHVVMILRGSGHVLVGESVHAVGPRDLIEIEPGMWHQFRATNNEPFGFLCLVNRDRDRPHRPDQQELAQLMADPEIAKFIKV